jgi:hypothetical protein
VELERGVPGVWLGGAGSRLWRPAVSPPIWGARMRFPVFVRLALHCIALHATEVAFHAMPASHARLVLDIDPAPSDLGNPSCMLEDVVEAFLFFLWQKT